MDRIAKAVGLALCGTVFGCALISAPADAQSPYSTPADAQRVFTIHNRSASELLPQVSELLGVSGGKLLVVGEKNQIVVRGDAATLNLAEQVIQQLDRAATDGRPHLQAYAAPPHKRAAIIAWRDQFTPAAGQRAAWDDRTGQLILLATPDVHEQVRQLLADQTSVGLDAPLRLANLTPELLHDRVQRLVGQPLPATWDAGRRFLSFPVRLGESGGVNLQVNAQSREVTIGGAPSQAAAWRKVIAALDSRNRSEDTTRVVGSETARSPGVRQALQAIQQSTGDRRAARGQFVATQLQEEEEGAGELEPLGNEDTPVPGRTTREQADALREIVEAQQAGSLLGPVQVEFIEGLDIIVLRGNEQDVQRVMQIIDQIERLSEVTTPSIEIFQLQHVDGESMNRLLTRVYQQVLGPRTGGVSVTTLGKPNELLLIGRPENVRMAVDLIKRLDKPADPTSQFVVFPLKNAAAADAKDLLDQFLEADEQTNQNQTEDTQPLLGPKAIVVADVRSNSIIVRAAPRDVQEISALLERIDVAEAASVDEVRVIRLRNARADELSGVLLAAIAEQATGGEEGAQPRSASLRLMTIDAETQRRLKSGVLTGVRIAPDIRANTLIVTAPAGSMELIAALVEQLDRAPDAEAELKVFTIQNGDAEALTEMLRSLFGSAEEDDPTAGGLSAGTNTLIRLQFSVDLRTNSIIAAGATEDLAIVEAILLRLDGTDTRDRRVEVFRLKNSPAESVAEAVNEWLQSKRDAEEAADLTISPFEQIEQEVIVVPELVSNSLIINASDELLAKITDLVTKLDERPPMVMIQVLIAEVKLNDTDEFGVELGLQDSLLFDRSVVGELNTITNTTQTTTGGGATTITETDQIVLNAPLTPGFNFNDVQNPLGNNGSTSALSTAGRVATQGLANFAVGRVNSELGFGGFVFSASSSSVNMLLRALQENRRLEVLSRPQIMALDNQQGTIRVGARVPTIQGVSFTVTGQQQNDVTYEDVGIILQVTPRISPDNQVVMSVYAEKSQLGPESEGVPIFAAAGGTVVRAPIINQTVAETVVAANSGQTVVLSGLLTKATADVHRRVPLLSDIPLLGDLFRYDGVSQERTELLIIMTPRVVRSDIDADMIKQVESARMSWVMCDVVNMHGPSGLKNRCDQWEGPETEAVFPTYVPAEEPMGPTPQDSPAQPELWQSGAVVPRTEDQNITPAGFTPGGGPGVPSNDGAADSWRLPPVK